MKIWITRHSASQIVRNGLSALDVWFTKPKWRQLENILREDTPYNISTLTSHKEKIGFEFIDKFNVCLWTVENYGNNETMWISFGKAFGFGDTGDKDTDSLALFVWDKLCEHFATTDIRQFIEAEETGRAVLKNFLLEIDLTVKIIQKKI